MTTVIQIIVFIENPPESIIIIIVTGFCGFCCCGSAGGAMSEFISVAIGFEEGASVRELKQGQRAERRMRRGGGRVGSVCGYAHPPWLGGTNDVWAQTATNERRHSHHKLNRWSQCSAVSVLVPNPA